MEAAVFAITAVLYLGLLSRRWNEPAAPTVCLWSIGVAIVAALDERWGWMVFYAACGVGGLVGLIVGRARRRVTITDNA